MAYDENGFLPDDGGDASISLDPRVGSDPSSSGSSFFSGALQTLTTLGTGYLSKRLDVDLTKRVYGAQAMPRLGTTQNPIGGYGAVVRTPQGQSVAQINLSTVLPLLGVALVVYMLARRGA